MVHINSLSFFLNFRFYAFMPLLSVYLCLIFTIIKHIRTNSWSVSGLSTSKTKEIRKVFITNDLTEPVLKEATI